MTGKGNTVVNDNVFLSAAQIVLQEAGDVVKQEKKGGPLGGLSQIFKEKFVPHIVVSREEAEEGAEYGSVSYDLKIAVLYGAKIPEVVADIREKLVTAIEEMTGYKVSYVDITVDRVIELKELEEEADKQEKEKNGEEVAAAD